MLRGGDGAGMLCVLVVLWWWYGGGGGCGGGGVGIGGVDHCLVWWRC